MGEVPSDRSDGLDGFESLLPEQTTPEHDLEDLTGSEYESLDPDEYRPSECELAHPQKTAMHGSEDEYSNPDLPMDARSRSPINDDPLESMDVVDHRAQYSKRLLMLEIYTVMNVVCCSEHVISNPSIWATAVEEIDSLEPKSYVSGSIINLFLLTAWYRSRENTYCHFVDLFMVASFLPPEPEEIARFRSYSGLFSNPWAQPPLKPVVFIVCRHQHYFTVCFDYETNHAWVFGRNPFPPAAGLHTNIGWGEWNGLMYWRRVAALFGWPVSDINPTVHAYDFKQVFIYFLPFHVAVVIDPLIEWFGLWTDRRFNHPISHAQRPGCLPTFDPWKSKPICGMPPYHQKKTLGKCVKQSV